MQSFYDSLGGIAGYQLKCLELIVAARVEELSDREAESSDHAAAGSTAAAGSNAAPHVDFLVPQGTSLQGLQGRHAGQRAAADGLRAVPELAEIYPLGGAQPAMMTLILVLRDVAATPLLSAEFCLCAFLMSLCLEGRCTHRRILWAQTGTRASTLHNPLAAHTLTNGTRSTAQVIRSMHWQCRSR